VSPVSVTYPNQVAYIGNRPYAEVEVFGPSGGTGVINALVDTGADYLTLPSSVAAQVVIAVVGQSMRVQTASGTMAGTLVPGVSVSIEGQSVKVDVLFDPSNATPPLLGRSCLLAAMEAGFNTTEWLWR